MSKNSEKLDKEVLKSLPEGVHDALSDPDTVDVFTEPEFHTSRTMLFKFGNEGVDMPSGKKLLVIVPDGADIKLQDVFLGHRKREKYSGLQPGKTFTGYDSNGAYTEVLVFDGKKNKWVSWKDPKGYDPIKFAEPRSTVEYEKLSDYYGMLGEIHPVAFLLISRGKGDPKKSVVTEHSLEVTSYPELHHGAEEIKRIFSPGTDFVDFKNLHSSQRLPRYGGGKSHHVKGPKQISGEPGGYPGAVPLRNKVGVEPFPMTEKVKNAIEELDSDGRLWVKVPEGKKILSVEIAAGARYWSGSTVPDKKLACIGGRKISVYIVNKEEKKIDHFMRSMNVGPQGVLLGGPTNPDYVTKAGDRILIEGEQHTSYVMGYRIIYKNAKGHEAAVSEQIKNKAQAVIAEHEPQKPGNHEQIHKLNLIKSDENCAGSEGGKWYIDTNTGKRYMIKTFGNSPNETIRYDRCATEYIANRIYRMMGVSVPESDLYNGNYVSRQVKGLKGFNSSEKSDKYKLKSFFQHPDVKNGFIVDAWLAHWDLFGLSYDNIAKSPDGRMLRIDVGGAMYFRGMGKPKAAFGNEEVNEVKTMKDPALAHEAGVIFQGYITENDIKEQVVKLSKLMSDEVIKAIVHETKISNAEQVINTLIKRRNWLIKNCLGEFRASKHGHHEKPVKPVKEEVKSQPKKPVKTEYHHGPRINLKPTNESCGGTQGAKWFIDTNSGDRFVVKTYGNSPNETARYNRCATEYITNRIYRLMGIPAPESNMYEGNVVSREIKSLKGFKSFDKNDAGTVKDFFQHPDMKNGFIVDAWLANWDVFGLVYDNVFKTPDNRMVRVDAGGALFYRGMGNPKPSFGTEKVAEIDTMRNPSTAHEAGVVYQGFITNSDIKNQVAKLAKVMTDDLIKEVVNETKISNAKEIIDTLIKRRNWLIKNYG